jgi:chemotaxis family two-component system sensor kinase Cph1
MSAPLSAADCALEPIHIPGSIQPHGFLLALREPSLDVTHASVSLGHWTDAEPAKSLGRPLGEAIGARAADAIASAAQYFGDLRERNPLPVVIPVAGADVAFDAILHRSPDGLLLAEFEPTTPSSFGLTALIVRRAVSELNRARSIPELHDIAARAVRELTGFDRVMIYRYDHEYNGEVVCEQRRDDLEPFLGLHYPASDIPAQARELYERNWIRLIADAQYEPSPVLAAASDGPAPPLDLSHSTLRSVSPMHVQYLRNMGVRASMSISLLRGGRLWGLIACHHYADSRVLPYAVRAAAEFLGSTLSLRLIDRSEDTRVAAGVADHAVLAKLTAATLDHLEPLVDALLGAPGLLDLVPGTGAAAFAEGRLLTAGLTPPPALLASIAAWAAAQDRPIVAVDSLTASAPELRAPPELVAGVLAVPLPDGQYLMWFRPEAPSVVNWAGDPNAKAGPEQSPSRPGHDVPPAGSGLGPRTSFALWREVIALRSEPWTATQVQLADDLRRHVLDVIYARSRQERRQAETLQRSLLPDALPIAAGWAFTARYETAEGGRVGGDWYDAFELGPHVMAIVLGDVAGHGLRAAGTMSQLRNALRANLLQSADPARALHNLNDFATRLLPGAFATAVAATIDLSTGRVRAASAGHLSPFLVDGRGRVRFAPIHTSMPLGIHHARYDSSSFTLERGSALVIFSDGLIERRTEDLDIGLDHLRSTLLELGPGPDADTVFLSASRAGAHDDATVLVVGRTPTTPEPAI